MANQYGPRIVTNGLVLCLDAGNNKSYPGSGNTWNDLSGNKNDGTLTNGPTYSSTNGGNIVFDGTNDRVTTSTNIAFGLNPFSISLWFKPNGIQGPSAGLMCIAAGGDSTNWQISFSDSGFLEFRGGTTAVLSSFSSSLLNNLWTNIFVVRESTNTNGLKIYINNILNITSTISNDLSQIAGYRIGVNRQNVNHYKGDISSIYIYSRNLSANEVNQNYNASKGRFGL